MENTVPNAGHLIGGTPLVELKNIQKHLGLQAQLLAKAEMMSLTGSVKDRTALSMITDAEKKGALHPGSVIVEPTSGNTGIALSALAAARGYGCILVMPDSMSVERIRLMECYGAQIVLTPGALGMVGAAEKARQIAMEIPNSFLPDQFRNPSNPAAHYHTTGPEIWQQSGGSIDLLVAGVGTGGTLTGAGRYLKEQRGSIRIIAVEPAESPLLSRGFTGSHDIQGIGPNFLPETLDRALLDGVIAVTSAEAKENARLLAVQEGLLAGISSGAALTAAITLARRQENAGKTIVLILPDTGSRYLSVT